MRLELGGDAGGVVVGGHQAGRVLDQVDPEQQPFAGAQAGGHGGEETGPLLDREIADGAAQKGDQAALGFGEAVEVDPEVADHARTSIVG